MVNVSELTLAVVRFEGAQDTLALTDIELPADLTEPKLSVCQLRGTGQACISLVRKRVSEPQGKQNGVQV